jgi:hypothetical protein
VTFNSDPPSVSGVGFTSTVAASPTSGVTANGTSTSLITVTIKDAAGAGSNPISNQTVTLAHTGSSVVTTLSGVTNQSGQATFSVTDLVAETVTYSATDQTAGGLLTSTATVAFVAGPASTVTSTVVASSTFVAAGSSTGVTITVTALDANNNPEVGDTLKLVAGSGASTISPSATQVANSSGVAIFTVKDNTTQNVTYTASDTTDAVTFTTTPTVTFDTGAISASLSTVSANLTSVAANGTTKSTITVTAKEANNTGIANDTITLAAGSGSSLITTVSGVTNASGVATFTVTDNTAQAVVYTATDITQTPPSTGVAITQTTTVTFTPDSASSSQSTATTNTGFVQNNGIASATITVTVKDSGGAPISNQVVTLAHTGSAVVTTVSGTTNSLGVATFTVTDTAFENVTFTATDNTGTAVIIGQQPTVFF